jgi:serine protease AprX
MSGRSRLAYWTPLAVLSLVLPAWGQSAATLSSPRLHPQLLERLAREPGPTKAWVFFTDKGMSRTTDLAAALQQVERTYNRRALERRALRGSTAARGGHLVDEHDLPIHAPYMEEVLATGVTLHNNLHWLNAITVYGTRAQFEQIARLRCVDRLEPVQRSFQKLAPLNVREHPEIRNDLPAADRSLDYGLADAQLRQINLIALHEAGFTGQGVIIGILDSGFRHDHAAFNNPAKPLQVLAEYDFVNGDENTGPEPGDPPIQHGHGTLILGCLASYLPGTLVGAAFDAQFVLAKTEDTSQEVPAEEDDFVAGLQFTEAHGADVTTASLGYIDWYTQAQLNGLTAVTTIAMNIHTGHGVHHTNAAGNSSHDSNPATSHLVAPADAFQCLTIGAVDVNGVIAAFSSDGPTADGRVKPELLTRGVSTHTVSAAGASGTVTADGTSLSTPLAAGAVACLVQTRPWWTVDEMRARLFAGGRYAASNGGDFDPLYVHGYGIINAYAAHHACAEAGVIELSSSGYGCGATATIAVRDCGLDQDYLASETVQVIIASTSEPSGETVTLTEVAPDAAYFHGTIPLSLVDSAGVLGITVGDAITATYLDEDDGAGGTNVPVTAQADVDCAPPLLSSVRVTDIGMHSAVVELTTDEPVHGTVRYGPSCTALLHSESLRDDASPVRIPLAGLNADTTWFLTAEVRDEAGNLATDPRCYSFITTAVPELLTEPFPDGIDLDYTRLMFVPNNSVSFYHGCSEPITALPTDPAGGTPLAFTNNDNGHAEVSLAAGARVALFGADHGAFFVGANGYITFGAPDTNPLESLSAHFALPRISALFDDLTAGSGSAVSWKQLADRVAVTYANVREFGSTNRSTFQVEMFFDGRIALSYLGINAADGLVGLSAGTGYVSEYQPTDLSNLGSCVPQPPVAHDGALQVDQGGSTPVTLRATDDGLPNPPGTLAYVLTALPAHGHLHEPGAGLIDVVPHFLAGSARQVEYVPEPDYTGSDDFQFQAHDGGMAPEGGDSNVATFTLTVQALPELIYSFPLDIDPGWSATGGWAWGPTVGGGSHARDPHAGHTGLNVYGYNPIGDYANNMVEPEYLTTPALDCRGVSGTQLRFWRWLGVEALDEAAVEVSSDGVAWTPVWVSVSLHDESQWTPQAYDISTIADGQPTVYIRWSMGPTNGAITYPGWSLDDVEIWGLSAPSTPGDLDQDGDVDLDDFAGWAECLAGPDAATPPPGCTALRFGRADLDQNGHVDLADFAAFQKLLAGP